MRRLFFIFIFVWNLASIDAVPLDKDLQVYPVYFSGGLTSIDPYNAHRLKPYSCINIENYYFDNNGLFKSRNGFLPYITIPTTKTANNLVLYKNITAGTINKLVSFDTDLYLFTSSTSEKLSLDTTIVSYNNYERGFIVDKSILYFGDGLNTNRKWSGSDTTIIYEMGLNKPQSAMVATLDTGGALSIAEYRYLYTYVSDKSSENYFLVESNPNENYTAIVVSDTTNNKVNLSSIIPSSNPSVTAINIYRTTALSVNIYFLLDTINKDSTTYIDVKSDTQLGAAQLDRYTRSQPPACKYFIKYKGRVFSAGNIYNPDKIYFSGYNTPEYVDLDYDYIRDIENNTITGLSIVNGNLIVFTDKSVWGIYIDDVYTLTPTNWRRIEISKSIGCISSKSIKNVENGVLFLSNKGLFSLGLDFAGDVSSNGAFLYLSEEIKSDYDVYMKVYPSFVSAIYKDFYYYLTYSTNGLYNNKVYVYNTRLNKGTFFTGYFINNFIYDNENDLFLGSSSLKDGKIYELDKNIYDGSFAFENFILSVEDVYSDVYAETVSKLHLTERLTTDTSVADTVLNSALIGQALYLFSGDTQQYINFIPILDNDSQSITIKNDFTSYDTGTFIKTGTRNHIIETVYHQISGEFIEKFMQYLFLSLYVENGLLEILAFYDNELSYITNIINNEQEVGFYINNDPVQYINDIPLNYLNDFIGFDDKYKVSYEIKNTFNQIKLKTIVNTFNALTPTKFFIWYKDLRVNWVGDK